MCKNLKSLSVASGNKTYFSKGNCIINSKTKELVAGCKNSVIPSDKGITSIAGLAFEGRLGLKSVKLPSKLKTVKVSAFYNTGLMSVTIPGSVKSIGRHSFGFNVYSEPKSVPGFTVKGSENSAAQKYAEKNHITLFTI